MDLTAEERELIALYRGLNDSKKKAVAASQNAFLSWVKSSAIWFWNNLGKDILIALFMKCIMG
jgi:hypothetical protein